MFLVFSLVVVGLVNFYVGKEELGVKVFVFLVFSFFLF